MLPHVPTEATRAQVKALAGYGIPQEGIVAIVSAVDPTLGSDDTLRKYYRAEIDGAAHEINAQVAQYAFGTIRAGQSEKADRDAKRAAEDMARFWLRYHPSSAWRRNNVDVSVAGELKHEHAGTVAVEATVAATVDVTALSDDDLARLFRSRVAGTAPAAANDRGPTPTTAALPAPRESTSAA